MTVSENRTASAPAGVQKAVQTLPGGFGINKKGESGSTFGFCRFWPPVEKDGLTQIRIELPAEFRGGQVMGGIVVS